MGRDNHPRVRQANKFARKQGKRAPADRLLIVPKVARQNRIILTKFEKLYGCLLPI